MPSLFITKWDCVIVTIMLQKSIFLNAIVIYCMHQVLMCSSNDYQCGVIISTCTWIGFFYLKMKYLKVLCFKIETIKQLYTRKLFIFFSFFFLSGESKFSSGNRPTIQVRLQQDAREVGRTLGKSLTIYRNWENLLIYFIFVFQIITVYTDVLTNLKLSAVTHFCSLCLSNHFQHPYLQQHSENIILKL